MLSFIVVITTAMTERGIIVVIIIAGATIDAKYAIIGIASGSDESVNVFIESIWNLAILADICNHSAIFYLLGIRAVAKELFFIINVSQARKTLATIAANFSYEKRKDWTMQVSQVYECYARIKYC
jgi:hypothetical protein